MHYNPSLVTENFVKTYNHRLTAVNVRLSNSNLWAGHIAIIKHHVPTSRPG